MKHRCPWCGEQVPNGNSIFFVYGKKCEHCENYYKAYRKTPVYIVFTFVSIVIFGFCEINDIDFGTIITIIIYLIVNLALTLCPYEKETNKYVIQRRFKAEIDFYNCNCQAMKFPKLTVIENQIFSICFVKNEVPISHMICAATENVKWNKKACNCILAFLPLGKLEKIYPAETEFYIFVDGKKVGKGRLVKYITDLKNEL